MRSIYISFSNYIIIHISIDFSIYISIDFSIDFSIYISVYISVVFIDPFNAHPLCLSSLRSRLFHIIFSIADVATKSSIFYFHFVCDLLTVSFYIRQYIFILASLLF
jgi:hypothetical protein